MHAFYDFTVCYNFSYVIDQASSLVNFFFEVHVYRMLVPEKIGNCDHIWHAVSARKKIKCFCLGSHALHFISFFLRKPTSASVLG